MNRCTCLRLLFVFALCIACIGRAQTAPLGAATPQEVLADAQRAFDQGIALRAVEPGQARSAFDRAVDAYGRLEAEFGIVNGGVLYNMGNCHLMSGRVGRAIASYRRALLLRPGDANIEANLHVARTRVPERIERSAGGVVLRALAFWRHWPGERKMIIALVANAAIWLVLAARVLGLRAPRWTAIAGATVAGVMTASLVSASLRGGQRAGVVVESGVIGRQGPGGEGEYEPSFTRALSDGLEFNVIEDRDRWVLIELGDGRQTWLPADVIEMFPRG